MGWEGEEYSLAHGLCHGAVSRSAWLSVRHEIAKETSDARVVHTTSTRSSSPPSGRDGSAAACCAASAATSPAMHILATCTPVIHRIGRLRTCTCSAYAVHTHAHTCACTVIHRSGRTAHRE